MNVLRRSQSFLGHFPRPKYCDVHLSTQDGAGRQPIAAHRVVLAAVSDKIEKLIDNTGEGFGPVVVRNIRFEVLEKIVEYIYFGRVQIEDSEDEIEDFLDGLDMLRVKVKDQVDLSEALQLDNIDLHSEYGHHRHVLPNISSKDVSVGVNSGQEAVSVGIQHDQGVVSVGIQHGQGGVSVGIQHDQDAVSVGIQHNPEAVSVGIQHDPETVSVGIQYDQEAVSVGVQHEQEVVSIGIQHDQEVVSIGIQHDQEVVSIGIQHEQEAVSFGIQHEEAVSFGIQHEQEAVSFGIQHEQEAVLAGIQQQQVGVSKGIHNNSLPANNEKSMTSTKKPQSEISDCFGAESENVNYFKPKVSNSSYAKSNTQLEKDETWYKCPFCKVHKTSKSYRSLLEHCRKFHSKAVKCSKKLVCDVCSHFQVVPEYCFELHQQCYHRSDPIEERVAGSGRFTEKAFSRRPDQEYLKNLQEEMISKKGPKARVMLLKLPTCMKCGGTFSDQTELSSHLKVVHH